MVSCYKLQFLAFFPAEMHLIKFPNIFSWNAGKWGNALLHMYVFISFMLKLISAFAAVLQHTVEKWKTLHQVNCLLQIWRGYVARAVELSF